jgi:hypothetical protein
MGVEPLAGSGELAAPQTTQATRGTGRGHMTDQPFDDLNIPDDLPNDIVLDVDDNPEKAE